MVTECLTKDKKALSNAVQSNLERATISSAINSSTSIIAFKIPQWKTLNTDLDLAVIIHSEIEAQIDNLIFFSETKVHELTRAKIQISLSDCYFLGVVLNLLETNYANNVNKELYLSIAGLSKALFGKSTNTYKKRVKKYLRLLSVLKLYDDDGIKRTILSFRTSTQNEPNIVLNEFFGKYFIKTVRAQGHDFLAVPKTFIQSHLSNLIKSPKAFCVCLELLYLESKNYLESETEGWQCDRQEKSLNRLNKLFNPGKTHSLCSYINKSKRIIEKELQGENVLEIVKSMITEDDINSFRHEKSCHQQNNEYLFNLKKQFNNKSDDYSLLNTGTY